MSPAPLPNELPRQSLARTRFDPFVGVVPARQPLPVAPPMVVAPPVVAPAPQPTAPALNYRYLGRLVDPTGKVSVYLAKGAKELLVEVGTQLDEGYVVEALGADAIRLHYPPLDTRAVINIPPGKE